MDMNGSWDGDRDRLFTLLMEEWSPIEQELMARLQRGEVDALQRIPPPPGSCLEVSVGLRWINSPDSD